MISEEEHDKNEELDWEVVRKLRNFSEGDCHNFTNGSQVIMAQEIIRLVHKHFKKGAYSFLNDIKSDPVNKE